MISISEPLTPILKRKNSLKKILISSPSQEIVRFLNIPNPSVEEDPRERLRIISPKMKQRSQSSNSLSSSTDSIGSPKSGEINRDCYIRKVPQSWKKTSTFGANKPKLQINNSHRRLVMPYCKGELNSAFNSRNKFNFTFGSGSSFLLA
jgi:hypothetical protein